MNRSSGEREESAILAGARPEAVQGALGNSLQFAFDRWYEWALRQRDFMIGDQPGITAEEYEAVPRRFGGIGISHDLDGTGSESRQNACPRRDEMCK
jgi:hypothetical protein